MFGMGREERQVVHDVDFNKIPPLKTWIFQVNLNRFLYKYMVISISIGYLGSSIGSCFLKKKTMQCSEEY